MRIRAPASAVAHEGERMATARSASTTLVSFSGAARAVRRLAGDVLVVVVEGLHVA